MNKLHEILNEFDALYATDGCGKAIVIIEDNENSSPSQRPAQDEIREFFKTKLVEYALYSVPEDIPIEMVLFIKTMTGIQFLEKTNEILQKMRLSIKEDLNSINN